jgi:hypothetical protein
VARLIRRWGVLTSLVVTSVVLSSCGTGGAVADARASCRYVNHALALQARSEAPGVSSARQAALQASAMSELLKATPSAAAATSLDGSWNPLMTTINEAERVPMHELVASLTRLCQVADSSSPYL